MIKTKSITTSFILLIVSLLFPISVLAETNIKVNAGNILIDPIPTDFLGFSEGIGNLCSFSNYAVSSPTLQNLFKNLAPGILRSGGTNIPNARWRPGSQCSDNEGSQDFNVTPTEVDKYYTFLNSVGWKAIWDLPFFNQSEPVDEAKYILDKWGSHLYAFELGNEWPISTQMDSWKSLARRILANYPNSPLSGPTAVDYVVGSNAGNPSRAFPNFLDALYPTNPDNIKLKLATFHYYSQLGNNLDSSTARAYLLNSQKLTDAMSTFVKPMVDKAKSVGLPVRMSEGNSFVAQTSDTGVNLLRGSSDTYTSTLWATDFMFSLLKQGVTGVNIHGRLAQETAQNAISLVPGSNPPQFYAEPLYYAMLLFKYAASNGKLVDTDISTTNNFRTWAVVNTDGKLQVIVLNKGGVSDTVNVTVPASFANAKFIRLRGTSLTSTLTSPDQNSIKLGGSPVSADGTWNPSVTDQLAVVNSKSSVNVPAYSAIVITFSPKIPGDFNGDGSVGEADLNLLKANFGNPYTIFDYNTLVANYGK